MGTVILLNSIDFAKAQKKEFVQRVVDKKVADSERKVAIFMAGAPGSGKTEVAESALSLDQSLCDIDADQFRSIFPGYNGSNSSDFQRGASYLVDYTFSWLIDHRFSVLLDGTFAVSKALENVKRVIDHNYHVYIYYVYQDPLIAWNFTQIREKQEGRFVPVERFINAYFEAYANVNQVKGMLGDKVTLDVFLKDFNNNVAEYVSDVQNLSLVVPKLYDKAYLERTLK